MLGRFGHHRRGASEAPASAQVIYDFQVDVWRVAVSIYNHALTNGLTEAKAESAVETFCEAYVEVVKGYVGNEDAELFEVKASTTPKDTPIK